MTSTETIDSNVYSDQGIIYNYHIHPKGEEFLDYYFSLPPLQKFMENLRVLNSAKVLDLGSGIGLESNRIRSLLPDAKVISIDISTTGSKSGKKSFNLNQIQADITAPPIVDQQFDGIHCKDVLVHIEDKNKLLKNIARLLKPGGTLILFSSQTAFVGFKQFKWDPDEIKAIAQEFGLELESQEKIETEIEDWYSTATERTFMIFKKRRPLVQNVKRY